MITEGNLCVRSMDKNKSSMDQWLKMVAERIYCENYFCEFKRIFGEELSLRRGNSVKILLRKGMTDKPK